MLKEAQRLHEDGIDIAIGIIETHGRTETAALLKNLKVIPLKTQNYKNKEFHELDVEAILAVHPQLVLVDELAHQNVPGSKHAKRWQDVLEILDNGIDVFTTLNVQHIESLNDIVRGITEIYVRETVPDHVIDSAASIQLVDLTPDELLQRLKEGRVYFDEQSKIASLNFFQREKLTALRELALRYAANKVDRDLHSMAIQEEKMLYWQSREKFMTAISSSQRSQKLIRTTKRLATAIDAPWIAVNVNTGAQMSDVETDQLARNFALARDLGAEVVSIADPSIIKGIERIVKQRGITQIIIGRPIRTFFKSLTGFSLVDQLTEACRDADIHIVKDEKDTVSAPSRIFTKLFSTNKNEYLHVLAIGTFLGLFNWLALPFISYKVEGAIFLIGVLSISPFYSRGPIIFAAFFFAFIWNFFFIAPHYSLAIYTYQDMLIFLIYMVLSLTLGLIITRDKEHHAMLEKSEESTRMLYEMAHQIATAPSTEVILKFIRERFNHLLHGSVEFAIRDLSGNIPWKNLHSISTEKEKAAANWTLENGKESGWSTDTLPSLDNLYIPLQGYHENIGLLIYKPQKKQPLTTEEKNFIYTVCQQVSHFLERLQNREKGYQHENLLQVQKIHKMILDRLSHAFQWPIDNAKAALKSLREQLSGKYPQVDIIENSLNVFTNNLENIATMADLSEGMIPLKKSEHSIAELIEESSQALNSRLDGHTLNITIEEDLPPLYFDYYLMQVLLNNILSNALEYSNPGTPIEITAKKDGDNIAVSVSNQAKPIPDDQLPFIFDKFTHLPDDSSPRPGLGLAIAKTIIELHQGTMKAENIPGGIRFTFTLPL
jgi:two-component system sensor histidine kinase KdpD